MILSDNVKFRHELKYLINYSDYELIRIRLKGLMKIDKNVNENGVYTIRSLYFDDIYNSAYRQKYMGVQNRQKYRLRLYNNSDKFIRLERKIKNNRYIHKQMAPLSKPEVQQLLSGDIRFMLLSSNNLLNVFYYECISKNMRPRVIIEYEREPYILDAGTVRITFDKNVRVGVENFDLFNPDLAMVETLEKGKLIMEVKYTEFLPNMIQKLLPTHASEYTAVSKYVMGCDRTLYKRQSNI